MTQQATQSPRSPHSVSRGLVLRRPNHSGSGWGNANAAQYTNPIGRCHSTMGQHAGCCVAWSVFPASTVVSSAKSAMVRGRGSLVVPKPSRKRGKAFRRAKGPQSFALATTQAGLSCVYLTVTEHLSVGRELHGQVKFFSSDKKPKRAFSCANTRLIH